MVEKERQPVRLVTKHTASQEKEETKSRGTVTVLCGVHKLENLKIEGTTVGETRKTLTNALNIDTNAVNLINGKEVDASHILKENDTLEFVRLAGTKG